MDAWMHGCMLKCLNPETQSGPLLPAPWPCGTPFRQEASQVPGAADCLSRGLEVAALVVRQLEQLRRSHGYQSNCADSASDVGRVRTQSDELLLVFLWTEVSKE